MAYGNPNKTNLVTTTPLGRQAQLFDLAHFYQLFHREAEIPRWRQKSHIRLQRISEEWRKGLKPQIDAASSLDSWTRSFSPFLEVNVVGWDQQPYGMEQQRAQNQPTPLAWLLICGHHFLRTIHGMTASQHPVKTIARSYLWRHDAKQVPFQSTSSDL